jgi:uncharacterized protein (UPF0332 family)
MSRDYELCLKRRRIVSQEFAGDLIKPELEDAKLDLARAKKTHADADYKWATIQAYYSMFHAARALLFNKGFREKSHACLKFAIGALYVETGILEKEYLTDFDTTMLLRETADYKSDFSQEGAEASIDNAERFLARVKSLLA